MLKLVPLALLTALFSFGWFTPASATADMAMLRVVHASPDAPEVDIYVDGARALAAFPYAKATDYLMLPAGERRLTITAADAPEAVVFDASVNLEADAAYTVIAAGLLNGTPAFAPIVLRDDLSDPAPGKARVRFVHVSPGTPAVDIAISGGPVLFGNVAFGADATGEVGAGTYDLEARPAGTDIVALPVPGVALDAGKIYTILAIGQIGGANPLTVLPLVFTPPAH